MAATRMYNSGYILMLPSTDGIGDLQSFVTVALATAAGGEGALTRDRLSDLGTVGTGFASIIFLKRGAGFKELVQQCSNVWEQLERNKRLPKLLVCCLLSPYANKWMVFKAEISQNVICAKVCQQDTRTKCILWRFMNLSTSLDIESTVI